MTSDPDVSVLLLGAGSGARIGGQPKAFLKLDGETFLERAVRTAKSVATNIVVGLPATDLYRGKQLVDPAVTVVAGGASRQETIERLSNVADGSILVVHDIARPFATTELYSKILQEMAHHDACAPACTLPVRDSLCRGEDGFVGTIVERENLIAMQTPQAYDGNLLREVLTLSKAEHRIEPSLVALFRHAGHAVKLVEGDIDNTKITYLADLPNSNNSTNGTI